MCIRKNPGTKAARAVKDLLGHPGSQSAGSCENAMNETSRVVRQGEPAAKHSFVKIDEASFGRARIIQEKADDMAGFLPRRRNCRRQVCIQGV
jgi:hypothetical protein